MADKIKAFFRQKKAEAKFKTAGGGQKLGDSSRTPQSATQQGKSHINRNSFTFILNLPSHDVQAEGWLNASILVNLPNRQVLQP